MLNRHSSNGVIWDFLFFTLKWMLGLGITATAMVAAAYAFFQFLGRRWLEARFAERLEKFKHDQNQEIERLRYRINALMDRTTKLHQHEFEVLPKCLSGDNLIDMNRL